MFKTVVKTKEVTTTLLPDVALLERSIDELRRMNDELSDSYNRIKTLTITFIGGSLAFLSFFYGSGNGGSLFIPDELYGQIIYALAVLFHGIGLSQLFLNTKPVIWHIPTDIKEHQALAFDSYAAFLQYCKEEYITTWNCNLKQHEKKQSTLHSSLTFLVISAIVLVIIKTFK